MGPAQDERKDSGQGQVALRQGHLPGGDVHRVVLAGLLLQRDGVTSGLVLGVLQRVGLGAGGVPWRFGARAGLPVPLTHLDPLGQPFPDVQVDRLLAGMFWKSCCACFVQSICQGGRSGSSITLRASSQRPRAVGGCTPPEAGWTPRGPRTWRRGFEVAKVRVEDGIPGDGVLRPPQAHEGGHRRDVEGVADDAFPVSLEVGEEVRSVFLNGQSECLGRTFGHGRQPQGSPSRTHRSGVRGRAWFVLLGVEGGSGRLGSVLVATRGRGPSARTIRPAPGRRLSFPCG
ncbi:hypothetical protein SMICM17S_04509 [Streptomyces microflavus]